ncbi:hypothetical protein TEU_04015 [Thermococcus eurythermalis]|uniref:Uncharacterized protein n=1 Tax=Thermococcus eurythermalis TaxID=1505907 RepID=A0A097QSX7_9EURY|nr:hypothetical protein [Thermococcus eurythermalis]AIU69571.1 hypothetical protein TEU_04015 [Thermococcus eurythermalis]
MTDPVKDSVEAALELDEKSVYSHIAHESAEDIVRIISSLDAERAKLKGEVIYYTDDWDALIRERIAKGKRHTAFDFYNPALLDIWEEKVKHGKKLRMFERVSYAVLGAFVALTGIATVITGSPLILLAVSALPLALVVRDRVRDSLDLIYYELTQFFIDELREIVSKHGLNPERYKFKLFTGGYFGVKTRKTPSGIFAVVENKSG